MSFRIPLTETTLGEEEVEAATRVLRSKWLTQGEEVAAFEREFAAAVGAREAVAVANCTLGLEIVYQALGLSGGQVIMPSITFVASFNAARRIGAFPVLADVVAEDDLTISLASIQTKFTKDTAAVVTMPHGGMPPAMESIRDFCAEKQIPLIEDACHAPLAVSGGRQIGSFGAVATWSFFGNKNLTTGEGGMITTDDGEIAARCRLLRSHGITRPTWDRARGHAFDYDVAAVGTNARMDEVRAAIGRVQLRKLPQATEQRRAAMKTYRDAFAANRLDGLVLPRTDAQGESNATHLCWCLLPTGIDRHQVMSFLAERGIQTSIHYRSLHRFTALSEYFSERGGAEALPVTESIEDRLVTLPLWPGMNDSIIAEVVETLGDAIAEQRPRSIV